jgi:hypothetical protein
MKRAWLIAVIALLPVEGTSLRGAGETGPGSWRCYGVHASGVGEKLIVVDSRFNFQDEESAAPRRAGF